MQYVLYKYDMLGLYLQALNISVISVLDELPGKRAQNEEYVKIVSVYCIHCSSVFPMIETIFSCSIAVVCSIMDYYFNCYAFRQAYC